MKKNIILSFLKGVKEGEKVSVHYGRKTDTYVKKEILTGTVWEKELWRESELKESFFTDFFSYVIERFSKSYGICILTDTSGRNVRV